MISFDDVGAGLLIVVLAVHNVHALGRSRRNLGQTLIRWSIGLQGITAAGFIALVLLNEPIGDALFNYLVTALYVSICGILIGIGLYFKSRN